MKKYLIFKNIFLISLAFIAVMLWNNKKELPEKRMKYSELHIDTVVCGKDTNILFHQNMSWRADCTKSFIKEWIDAYNSNNPEYLIDSISQHFDITYLKYNPQYKIITKIYE